MMPKRTLGTVVKEARDGARMTQRDLAAAVGMKASHVAYIESGQRKPSISLINRLSETLGLDAKELLVLAHPEAKQIVDGDQPSAQKKTMHGRVRIQRRLDETSRGHARRTQGFEAGFDTRARGQSRTVHLHPERHPAGGDAALAAERWRSRS